MICYKDRSYCSASLNPCVNKDCYRFLSAQEAEYAKKRELPIAFSPFHINCKDIRDPEFD